MIRRALETLVARLLPPAARDATIGDLQERHRARVRRDGAGPAARWHARQLVGFLLRLPIARAGRGLTRTAGVLRRPSGLAADIRHAGRAAIRQPALTTAVVLVLALAVGATTTVFGVVRGVLLRPLPYADPDALVMLWDEYPPEAHLTDPMPVTRLHYDAWRDRTEVFAAVGAFESTAAALDAGDWPDRVDAALVSSSLLPALGAVPALGRSFTAEDDRPGAAPVVILSHALWVSVFGGDPGAIGRSIRIDGEPTEIIGVMPADFWFYDPYAATRSYAGASASAARLWRPIAGRFPGEIDYPRYRVVARLRPGVARAAAAAVAGQAERTLPSGVASADGRVRVVPLREQIVGAVRPRLLGLAGAVVLVLLVAAVNLASLFVARVEAHRTEFAIRAALGADRARLLRGFVVHGALLGFAGGAAGLLLARAALPLLLGLVPRGLPLAHRVGMDAVVAAFAIVLSTAVGAACTAAAAWPLLHRRRRAREGSPLAGGAPGARGEAGRAGGRRARATMIAAEVALSLVLLVSATLLLRNLGSLYAADTGFESRRVLTFQSLLMIASPGAAPDFALFDRLEAGLAALPGVEAVGSGTILPFSRWSQTVGIRAGEAGAAGAAGAAKAGDLPRVQYRVVSPGYFDALRIARRAGRPVTAADAAGTQPVAVVNTAFAERYLGGVASAVGRQVGVARGRDIVDRIVVGVVADVRESRLYGDPRPMLYAPLAQSPMPMRQFVVRAAADPAALVPAIRRAAAEIAPGQPLQDFITMDALIAQTVEEERFYAVVAAAFAGAAVLLALVGLYGVVSFATRQRDREVGVRIALGATRAGVYRLIVGGGMRPVGAGLVLGALGAAAAGRLLRSLLHGVPALDPVSYVVAIAAFGAVAFVACALPARRAAGVDPARTLTQGP